MPIPTHRCPDHQLDHLLRAALTGKPQRHTVWAMLHEPGNRAIPIKVQLEIRNEDGGLTWTPIAGHGLGGEEVPLEVLRGDQIWWASWVRKFAASRLRVELTQAIKRQEMLDRYSAVNGDKEIRVLTEFPGPRGYGEG